MMTLEALQDRLREEERSLRKHNGETCLMSKDGPISLGLVKAIVEMLGEHEAEIKRLKGIIAMRG